MSDNAQYQVVGECAYATTNTAVGRAKVLLYKGALVSADAPELKHLLTTGLVAKVGGEETGGVNADGLALVEVPGDKAAKGKPTANDESKKPDPEAPNAEAEAAAKLEADRAAAREKLPEDGSTPHPNAGQPVWVEWHVKQGRSYEELAKADKKDLVELAKASQS